MRLRILLLVLLALLATACNSGFPREPGRYAIQPGSLSYDGDTYRLLWVDGDGKVQQASGDDVRMVRDEQTFLEVGSGSPVIHLRPDERVALHDRQGQQSGWWVPFLIGSTLGRGPVVVPAPGDSRPSYRYPPPPSRPGETVSGSQTSERPLPVDRRPQPAAGTVSGQAGGTGGGTAATGKIAKPVPGQGGGSGAGSAATGKLTLPWSGQAGGVGSGSAAAGKRPALGGKPSTGFRGARSSGGFGGFRGRR